VISHGFKTLEEIAACISTIDVGVIPNRSSSFTQINFPTRIFEYLAMHKPVIVPATTGITDYFQDDEILFFEAGSVDNLAARIEWAYRHPAELREVMAGPGDLPSQQLGCRGKTADQSCGRADRKTIIVSSTRFMMIP